MLVQARIGGVDVAGDDVVAGAAVDGVVAAGDRRVEAGGPVEVAGDDVGAAVAVDRVVAADQPRGPGRGRQHRVDIAGEDLAVAAAVQPVVAALDAGVRLHLVDVAGERSLEVEAGGHGVVAADHRRELAVERPDLGGVAGRVGVRGRRLDQDRVVAAGQLAAAVDEPGVAIGVLHGVGDEAEHLVGAAAIVDRRRSRRP